MVSTLLVRHSRCGSGGFSAGTAVAPLETYYAELVGRACDAGRVMVVIRALIAHKLKNGLYYER